MEVVDLTRDVFGLFIDALYGLELAWDTLPLATIFGLYCLADKYLVNSLKAGITRKVTRYRQVDTKDLEDLLEGADEAVLAFHVGFVEALTWPIVTRLVEVQERAVEGERLVEEYSRYEAPVTLSKELADIVGTDEMVKDEVETKVRGYMAENRLVTETGSIRLDEKLSRIVPSNPEARKTRSRSILPRDTFFHHLRSHIGAAATDRKEEVLELLTSLQVRLVEAKARVEPWVEWVRRACAVGEAGMKEVDKVRKKAKVEGVLEWVNRGEEWWW